MDQTVLACGYKMSGNESRSGPLVCKKSTTFRDHNMIMILDSSGINKQDHSITSQQKPWMYIAETISNSPTFHYSKPCDTLTVVCTRGSLPASTTNKDLLSQVEGQSTWARGAHRPEPRSFPGLGPLRSNMPATVRGDPPFTWDSTCFMVAFKAYELRHTGIWSLLGWDSTHLFCDHVQSRHPCPAAILTTILRVQGIYGFS